MGALARAVAQELQRAEPGREIDWSIDDGLIVDGDERLLRIALENLLGNAWKFTATRNRAEISFGRTTIDGSPAYFIRDNGVGFDMAYVDRLFNAFQRLHSTQEFAGSGVGLATVRRVIVRHGGKVWAEAIVDRAATFYFTLPDSKEMVG
ncbi:MAG TPA: ATP-binding protein [Chloroflexota bacterium]|nr:ATP-binding protein [Chloroflexota bacterium]